MVEVIHLNLLLFRAYNKCGSANPSFLLHFFVILPILHRLLFPFFSLLTPHLRQAVSLLFAEGSGLMEEFNMLSLVWPFSSMDPG